MNSRPLMLLRLDTSATEEIGSTPRGALSIFPVTGGSFEGKLLRGKVLAGGGKRERTRYSRYAKATFRKDRRLNIRLSSKDLEAIQKRALAEGLPYQTLIASLLHKYASGRLKEV